MDDTDGFEVAGDTGGFKPTKTPPPDTGGFMPAGRAGLASKITGWLSSPDRYQMWPERMVRSAATLPGDVMKGSIPAGIGALGLRREDYTDVPNAPQPAEAMMERAGDLSGLVGGTGFAGVAARGAEKSALGAFPVPAVVKKAGQEIEKVFSPETLDVHAESAASLLRSTSGRAARDTEVTRAALEPYHRQVNALDDAGRTNFIAHVEGSPTAAPMPPELRPLADVMKEAFDLRKDKLLAMPSTAQTHFIDEYFPHFWKDPDKAKRFATEFTGGGVSKQGSGASLKARTVPTIADGVAAGLEPITLDPIASTMRYVTNMDQFIGATEALNTARENGTVIYVRPKVVGASGHPESFKVPEGYAPLEGRGATNAAGAKAYAPESFARVYNNFISQGLHATGLGNLYEGARMASNAVTGLELGLSGYHAATMMQESIANGVTNAIGALRSGRPLEAIKLAAQAPFKPVTSAASGTRVQDAYLGKTPGTQEMRQVVDLLTEAGGRAVGKEHAPELNFSKHGDYWTSFKRGSLGKEWSSDKAAFQAAPLSAGAQLVAKHVGRIIDTIAYPIFQSYIPKLKDGAFKDNMSQWLKNNPTAPREEQIRAARQIWDSVDNRFGEMVQDNMFMNKVIKQLGTLFARSFSWTVGSGRELVGAARDVVRAPVKAVRGTGPNDTRWTQKMDYALALPITYGTMAAVYQYLKTGEGPQDERDVQAPRTGGVDANSGEPERLQMPGYMKDVFGFMEHPVQEVLNKVATAPRMAGELLMNKDWRGDPIRLAADADKSWAGNAVAHVNEYADYLGRSLGPISVRNLMRGQKEGSNISGLESLIGVKTAPRQLIDPEGHAAMMQRLEQRAKRLKLRHDAVEKSRYGGPVE